MRTLRTFYDEEGQPYVMPVDVDHDYWTAMDRVFNLTAVGDEFEWNGVHPDELRPAPEDPRWLRLRDELEALPRRTFVVEDGELREVDE